MKNGLIAPTSYVYDTESSLYYLQSRYYNANVGRFINADILVSTGQGLLGNNMFAYCNNCPIVFSDVHGSYPQTINYKLCLGYEGNYLPPTLGEYIESIAPPPRKTFDELIGHTHSLGLTIGSSMSGLTMGKSYSISCDSNGVFSLQETDAYGSAASAGLGGGSIGLSYTFTNAENVQELDGEARVFGGTLCVGIGISLDFISFVTSSGEVRWGITVAALIGAEAEIHASDANAYSTKSGRLFDLFR